MPRHIIASTLVSTTLLLCTSLAPAAENKPATPIAKQSLSATTAPKKNAKMKLVDLNHASKAELRSLPGITDTMAAKIIAGRPYNSKAAIVTDGIVPAGIFLTIKARIVVK